MKCEVVIKGRTVDVTPPLLKPPQFEDLFSTSHCLTVAKLRYLMADLPPETVITVCGSEEILLRREAKSLVNPEILSFDSGDIEPDDECVILFRSNT